MLGIYYSDELNTMYRFVIKDNELIVTHSKLGEIALMPFQPDVFQSSIGTLAFVRDDKNKVIGFNMSTQGTHQLRFNKLNFQTDSFVQGNELITNYW